MLGLIHESHFGIETSRSCARELLYWPKMGAVIERTVANGELCRPGGLQAFSMEGHIADILKNREPK